jgi:hypothetical protein
MLNLEKDSVDSLLYFYQIYYNKVEDQIAIDQNELHEEKLKIT